MSTESPPVCVACRLGAHDRCRDPVCWCHWNDHTPDDTAPEAA